MSLSTFFRDYVYIPLGGNRKHVYLNVAIVFLLTGIWHGAAFAFIFWGIWHGFFNIMEKLIKDVKKKKGVVEEENTKKDAKYYLISALQHIYTMAVVMVGWVFFRAPGMTHGFNYLKSMFGLHNPEVSAYNVWLYLNKWSLLIMILALFMCTPIFKKLYGVAKKKINENILIPIKYLVLLGALLLCVLQVASNTYSAFIYFQF